MNILLCEDDIGIQDLVAMLVEDIGHNLIRCDEEDTALSLLDKETIDLVIMDYWLGDTKADGIIKKMKLKNRSVPIMLISAANNLEETYKDLEVEDYLKKPFDIIDFKSKITNLLNGSHNSAD